MGPILPERDLAPWLSGIDNPSRYLGGEYGQVLKPDADFRVAVSYPDLYEIGMSNQAVAILYGLVNSLEGCAAQRVFAPAEDFEALLKEKKIPLYGLEGGTPLKDFDLLAFTLSYELCATNILTILETGGIPLLNHQRGPEDPIILAGGPVATNPLPFGDFIDGIFIGEAEEEFRNLVRELAEDKKQGKAREFLLERIKNNTHIWFSGKTRPARRAVWGSFSWSATPAAHFPVPSMRTVQDHGVVEIMRGCPHGCRFCHAGILYRPYRMKDPERIAEEVQDLVRHKGYREITLSSLSSGDYTDLEGLVRRFNKAYAKDYVSFALPSLHLETLGIQLLAEISSTRKSGLTFAIETPDPNFQRAINKEASREKILQILEEAREQGWRAAKLYFMIGLPFGEDYDEVGQIADYVRTLHQESGFRLHVNVGTFIPKPHTPYQWSFQLSEKEALNRINSLKRRLSAFPKIKISYHSPFRSFMEGIIARGDRRAGELILAAYRAGARLDSWEDRPSAEVWRSVIAAASWDVEKEVCSSRPLDQELPWQREVHLGVTRGFLREEYRKHQAGLITGPCTGDCDHHCGICNPRRMPLDFGDTAPSKEMQETEETGAGEGPREITETSEGRERKTYHRILCRFEKTGKAAYLPHLGLLSVIERSLLRAGFQPRFTEGFNPKPVMEFAQPLPVGMSSEDEFFSFDSEEPLEQAEFLARINPKLPQGLRVKAISRETFREGEKKPRSLMSRYTGAVYLISFSSPGALAKTLPKLSQIPHLIVGKPEGLDLSLEHIAQESGRGFVSLFREHVGALAGEDFWVQKLETRLGD